MRRPFTITVTGVAAFVLIAAVTANAPGRSKDLDRSGGPSVSMIANAAAIASPASGTLTRKTARHPNALVSTPPSSTPITRPAAPAPAHSPSARLRSYSIAKVRAPRSPASFTATTCARA